MNGDETNRELDYFLSNVTEKTCQLCHRKEQCWTKNFNTTYDYMREIMTEMEDKEGSVSQKLYREWEYHCINPKKIIEAMQQELTYYQANQKLKRQVQESRRLVADQF